MFFHALCYVFLLHTFKIFSLLTLSPIQQYVCDTHTRATRAHQKTYKTGFIQREHTHFALQELTFGLWVRKNFLKLLI